jgi:hypothetical protein
MPTLIELKEQVVAMDSGGIFTDESRFNDLYINALIHQYRADAIFSLFHTTGRPHEKWTQTHYLTYDPNLQESNLFVRFACPAVITVDQYRDGFQFIGQVDGLTRFGKTNTRADMANNQLHRFTKLRPNKPEAYWGNGFLDIYGSPLLRKVRVDGIFSNPEEVSTYNMVYDQYPLDDEGVVLLKTLLYQKEGQQENSKVVDTRSDSQDTPTTISTQK